MRSRVVFSVALIFAFGMLHLSSADFLEYLWPEKANTNLETREDGQENLKTCECQGPACMCCVDFNLTYIDLGGPGCVQMKYISQEEGLKLNVSYGESLLHSQHVKGPNPNATCMALLTNIAEICARFSNLLPHMDGLRGCLLLEPKLLGAVTATFKIGCFTMGPEGMTLEERNETMIPYVGVISNNTHSDSVNETEIIGGDLLAVVNETAEQGLAFLGNLLGLAFSEAPENNSEQENSTISGSSASESAIETTSANTMKQAKSIN